MSVAFSTGYGRSWFSGDTLDDYDIDMTQSGWSFGASAGVVVNAENMKLIPTVGVSHSLVELTTEQKGFSDVSIDDAITDLSIGVTMALQLEKNAMHDVVFQLTPNVSVDEDNTTFGINFGVFFTEKQRNVRSTPNHRKKRPYTRFTPEPIERRSRVRVPELSQPRQDTLPFAVVIALTQDVPENTAVRVTPQDAEHAESLAQVFKVTPESIRTFRWGNSMAGPGHPHHQTTWFVIEYGDGDYRARETIRIDASGGIIEHVKE